MPIRRWIKNLENLKQNLQADLDLQINSSLDEFEDMQRERLSKGIASDGQLLRRDGSDYYPYSDAYEKRKKSKGGNVSVVDLKLTGDYYSRIMARKVAPRTVQLTNTTKQYLEEQYKNIYGFAPNQKAELKRFFAPKIQESIIRNLIKK